MNNIMFRDFVIGMVATLCAALLPLFTSSKAPGALSPEEGREQRIYF